MVHLQRRVIDVEALMKHPGFDKVWVTTPGGIAEHAARLPAACVP